MLWIYAIPAWLFVLLAIAGITSLSIAGLFFTRRSFPHSDQITHNDVAGPIVATLGTVLAVVLSFMVVTVWQEFDAAAQTVQGEVNAICDLYHTASALQQPLKGRVQSELQKYVDAVVHDEWPLMRRGLESRTAHVEAFRVLHIVTSFKPKGTTQDALQGDMISLSHAFNDARRERLFDNRQAIPYLLWLAMLFVTAVTIASTYFFRVASVRAHATMIAALSAVIATILVLIAEFDLPFRGDVQVPPSAYAHAYAAFRDDPPNSVYSPIELK